MKIKTYNRYIAESVSVKEFKYIDYIQSLLDLYESDKHVHIQAIDNQIDIIFKSVFEKETLDNFSEIGRNMMVVSDELKRIRERCEIDGLIMECLKSSESHLQIKIVSTEKPVPILKKRY